jgi:transposase-like protein
MKTRQRRNFSAEMKSRIALEAIKGQKTIQEIASHYGVHPNQVTNWKRQAVEGLSMVFADRRSRSETNEETVKAELYQQIGEMKVELDWLKKRSGLSR